MITEVNLSVFVYRLFHEDFSLTVRINLDGSSTISMHCLQNFGRMSGWVIFNDLV